MHWKISTEAHLGYRASFHELRLTQRPVLIILVFIWNGYKSGARTLQVLTQNRTLLVKAPNVSSSSFHSRSLPSPAPLPHKRQSYPAQTPLHLQVHPGLTALALPFCLGLPKPYSLRPALPTRPTKRSVPSQPTLLQPFHLFHHPNRMANGSLPHLRPRQQRTE